MALLKKKKNSEAQLLPRDDLVTVKENAVVGFVYECKKNPKKSRLKVLKKMKVGSLVDFEFYFFDNEPAYLLIDRKSGLDFGNLSRTMAASIFEHYPNATIVGQISDISSDHVHVRYEIYGEAFFTFISRSRVNVLYKCWKDGKLIADQKLFTRAYDLSEREDLTGDDAVFVAALRNAVEDCFNENYDSANQRLNTIK